MSNKLFYVTIEKFYSGLKLNKTEKEFYIKITSEEVQDILTDETVPHEEWDKTSAFHYENTFGDGFVQRVVIDVCPAS